MTDAATRAHQLETQELLREIRDVVTPEKPITELSRAAFDKLSLADQAAAVKNQVRMEPIDHR
jgi:hypothetical protein